MIINYKRILMEVKCTINDPEMLEYKRQFDFHTFFDLTSLSKKNLFVLKAILYIKLAKFDKAIEDLNRVLHIYDDNNVIKIFLFQTLYANSCTNYDKNLINQLYLPRIEDKIDFLSSAIFYAIKSEYDESVFFFKEFINSSNIITTVLHLAVEYGLVDLTNYIIKNTKCDIEQKDYLGWTPLHWASWLNRVKILQLLIKSNADLEAKDILNATPFYLAAFNGHIDTVNILVKYNVDLQAKNINTNAAIHMASYFEHTKVIDTMIQHGIDINMPTERRHNTPLHVAAWHGKLKSARYLLSKGADINSKQVKGGTPLHRAALNGKLDMVKFLFDKGADINSIDQLNRSPLYCAKKNNHKDVEIFLISNGAI